jgi:anti-anti-sigma factor
MPGRAARHAAPEHAAPGPAAPGDPAPDEVVVALDEALLADGLADARWLLHQALLGGARRIVVDLARVDSLASPALASFLWAHRICRARGGGVVLRGADRRTADMLRRTGLWRVLQLQTGPAPGRPPGPGRRRGTPSRGSPLDP